MDIVFLAVNLILNAIYLQFVPTAKCIIAMVLTIITVFTALIGVTRRKSVYVLASFFSAVFVFSGVLFTPAYHGVQKIDGDRYMGLGAPEGVLIGTLEKDSDIRYHKIEFPFVIQKDCDTIH